MFVFQGDAAIGKGVNRHTFTFMMEKLKSGFALNLGLYKIVFKRYTRQINTHKLKTMSLMEILI